MSVELLKAIIESNNTMYAEEGTYKGISMLVLGDGTILIMWINLEKALEVSTYKVTDLDGFMVYLKSIHEDDGGEQEYPFSDMILYKYMLDENEHTEAFN